MSILYKNFKTEATIPYYKIADDVSDWDSVDDIVEFIMLCIADGEVASAVVESIKEREFTGALKGHL